MDYRAAHPQGTWEQMKDDPLNSGKVAYRDSKTTLVQGQRGLCAFCEIRIADDLTVDAIEVQKQEQRIEHFHPKEDILGPRNWALDWSNLWGVCHGGSNWPPRGEPLNPARHIEPLRENLSCDAFKARQIEIGSLNNPPEGWILAPDQIPAFPILIQFVADGTPEPNPVNCKAVAIPGNKHPDTETIVAETIKHLNLSCNRLIRLRQIARAQLEREIARRRKAKPGESPQEVLLHLARKVFSQHVDSPWPPFFTLLRWRLGGPAEQRLNEMGYTG